MSQRDERRAYAAGGKCVTSPDGEGLEMMSTFVITPVPCFARRMFITEAKLTVNNLEKSVVKLSTVPVWRYQLS